MIKKLPLEVINRIAAGEVIHRPVNVIKELVENSIDANSTKILILIEQGGLKKIQINDNGHGIKKQDYPLLCQRFATSKLQKIEDFEKLDSFGFRGQALASLSYVTEKLTIISRHKDSPLAYSAEYKDEKLVKKGQQEDGIKPMVLNCGTKIIASGLFSNFQTRRQSLSANEQKSKIMKLIYHFALHYCKIQFKLITQKGVQITTQPQFSVKKYPGTLLHDSNTMKRSEGDIKMSFFQKLTSLPFERFSYMDKRTLKISHEHQKNKKKINRQDDDDDDQSGNQKNSQKMQEQENLPQPSQEQQDQNSKKNQFTIQGIFTKLNAVKSKTLLLNVNNRIIENNQLYKALQKAYSQAYNSIHQENTTFYAYLSLQIDPKRIDANVQPTKKSIGFFGGQTICQMIKEEILMIIREENVLKGFTSSKLGNRSQPQSQQSQQGVLNYSKLTGNLSASQEYMFTENFPGKKPDDEDDGYPQNQEDEENINSGFKKPLQVSQMGKINPEGSPQHFDEKTIVNHKPNNSRSGILSHSPSDFYKKIENKSSKQKSQQKKFDAAPVYDSGKKRTDHTQIPLGYFVKNSQKSGYGGDIKEQDSESSSFRQINSPTSVFQAQKQATKNQPFYFKVIDNPFIQQRKNQKASQMSQFSQNSQNNLNRDKPGKQDCLIHKFFRQIAYVGSLNSNYILIQFETILYMFNILPFLPGFFRYWFAEGYAFKDEGGLVTVSQGPSSQNQITQKQSNSQQDNNEENRKKKNSIKTKTQHLFIKKLNYLLPIRKIIIEFIENHDLQPKIKEYGFKSLENFADKITQNRQDILNRFGIMISSDGFILSIPVMFKNANIVSKIQDNPQEIAFFLTKYQTTKYRYKFDLERQQIVQQRMFLELIASQFTDLDDEMSPFNHIFNVFYRDQVIPYIKMKVKFGFGKYEKFYEEDQEKQIKSNLNQKSKPKYFFKLKDLENQQKEEKQQKQMQEQQNDDGIEIKIQPEPQQHQEQAQVNKNKEEYNDQNTESKPQILKKRQKVYQNYNDDENIKLPYLFNEKNVQITELMTQLLDMKDAYKIFERC